MPDRGGDGMRKSGVKLSILAKKCKLFLDPEASGSPGSGRGTGEGALRAARIQLHFSGGLIKMPPQEASDESIRCGADHTRMTRAIHEQRRIKTFSAAMKRWIIRR